MVAVDSRRAGDRPLKGWKEIAAFFAKDERTVKRWEAQRGLPVHRVPGSRRATVYAWPADLDSWLTSNREDGAKEAALPAPVARPVRWWMSAALVFGFVAVGASAFYVGALRRDHGGYADVSGHLPSTEAHELYLAGVYHLSTRQAEGIRQSIDLFNGAIAKDPDYASAYARLADAYNLISQYTSTPAEEAYPKARAAAERAIALAPREAGGYAALAFNTFYWQRDFKSAQALFEHAVALDPNDARTHHWFALAAMHDRHFEVSLREIMRAQALAPASPGILANKALILFHAGDARQAESILLQLSLTQPKLQSPPAYLATLYLAGRRYEEFLIQYREAAELSGNAARISIAEAAAAGFERDGETGMLTTMLNEQKRQFEQGQEPAFKLALTAALLGDTASALAYLDTSLDRREQDILGIRLEPALAGLSENPHYREIVDKVGFSPS